MHVSLMFPMEYLCAADLQGRDVTLTIHSLSQDQLRVENGTEDKWILRFAEMEARHRKDPNEIAKKLVLNKTNAKTIAKLLGNETDGWKGQPITMYPTTCKAFGEVVDCIRVRSTVKS